MLRHPHHHTHTHTSKKPCGVADTGESPLSLRGLSPMYKPYCHIVPCSITHLLSGMRPQVHFTILYRFEILNLAGGVRVVWLQIIQIQHCQAKKRNKRNHRIINPNGRKNICFSHGRKHNIISIISPVTQPGCEPVHQGPGTSGDVGLLGGPTDGSDPSPFEMCTLWLCQNS